MAATSGLPTVSVPVLSNTTVVTWPARSRAAPSRIRMPRWAATFDPAMMAAGVASPMAQGQAIISTAAAIIKPAAIGVAGGWAGQRNRASQAWTSPAESGASPHQSPAAKATATTTGTKTLLTRSPRRWIRARLLWARWTAAMMCASAVCSPVAVTRMTSRPLTLAVPAQSRLPADLSEGVDSPVSIDSSTAESPAVTVPSVGTRSPGRKTTVSPARSSATGTCVSAPSAARRRAVAGARFSRLRKALEARTLTVDSSQCPTLTSAIMAAASMKYRCPPWPLSRAQAL